MNRASICLVGAMVAGVSVLSSSRALAEDDDRSNACKGLPTQRELRTALNAAQAVPNGGFGFEMWGTIVNRDGVVCAVAFTGADRGDQWPGSRVISAQKANTANAFSLPEFRVSTANLYSAVQPGAACLGSRQVIPSPLTSHMAGSQAGYGQANDPMVGGRIGGVNVFGGGLALYNVERAPHRWPGSER